MEYSTHVSDTVCIFNSNIYTAMADPGDRVRIPTGAWISVSCVCYELSEVSVRGRSLVQRSTTGCLCLTGCDLEASTIRSPWSTGAVEP